MQTTLDKRSFISARAPKVVWAGLLSSMFFASQSRCFFLCFGKQVRNFIIYLGPLGESVILANEPVSFTNNLTEWLARTGIGNWSICWRATRDGWAASKFHSNCDGRKPTLTIVQVVKNTKTYVFGGYATEVWDDPDPQDGTGKFSNSYNCEVINTSQSILHAPLH